MAETAYAIAWLRLREDGTVYVSRWGIYSEPPGRITHGLRDTVPAILIQADGPSFDQARARVLGYLRGSARLPDGQVASLPMARLVDVGEGKRLG